MRDHSRTASHRCVTPFASGAAISPSSTIARPSSTRPVTVVSTSASAPSSERKPDLLFSAPEKTANCAAKLARPRVGILYPQSSRPTNRREFRPDLQRSWNRLRPENRLVIRNVLEPSGTMYIGTPLGELPPYVTKSYSAALSRLLSSGRRCPMFGFWKSGPKSSEKRSASRRQVAGKAIVRQPGREVEATIRDISTTGVQVIVDRPLPAAASSVGIKIDKVGFISAKIAWVDGNRIGAAFENVSPAMLERIAKL
jgi:hypothetical protein